jgi:hypothetical protein
MKRYRILAFILVLVLVLAGCSSSRQNGVAPAEPGRDEGYFDKGSGSGGDAAPQPVPPYTEDRDGSYGNAEQRLIRTAQLSLDVQNLDSSLDEIMSITRAAGGFVSQSSISGADESRRAYLTIRVPSLKLEQVLNDIEATGKRTYRETGSQDVTLQYVDLDARIRNAERQEERLLSILEKAETIEELLLLEQELARVRGNLESMTAEFRYLSDRVDFASLSVSLRETPTASPTITGSGLKGVWQRGIAGLVNTINAMVTSLGNFMVFILSAFPYLLLLTGIGYAVALVLKKILAARRSKTPEA